MKRTKAARRECVARAVDLIRGITGGTPVPRKRLAVVLAFLFSTASAHAAPLLKDGGFLAICGASVTERRAYSVQAEMYLLACQPLKVRTAQFGWSGETIPAFLGRMKDDVLPWKPTFATINYGLNDSGYSPMEDEKAKRFRDGTDGVIKTFKEAKVGVLVMSVTAVDTTAFKMDGKAPGMINAVLAGLRDISRDVAAANQVPFVDLHKALLDVMAPAKARYGNGYKVSGDDGIHPNGAGSLVMTYQLLKGLGFEGDIGTITVDLAAHTARGENGHEILSFVGDAVNIRSSRYPFCLSGDPKNDNAASGMVEFIPFNQELNRFTLKLANTDVPRYRVIWGNAPQVFTADQLKAGVNLAAEYPTSPFQPAWNNLEKAVRAKQDFEVAAFKNLLPGIRRNLPNEPKAYDETFSAVARRHEALTAVARDAVIPITHTIKIEPIDASASQP